MDKLGVRLRDQPTPAAADVELYEELLAAYEDALELVVARLGMLGFAPSSRAKVLGTVIQKLRRQRSCGLSSVQDLVGARVVLEGDLDAQDAAVERFRGALPIRKVIDRRINPSAGYRAVHAVAKVDGIPVEVQFRTELQHTWAQIFEKLADRLGRQIRYAGEPAEPNEEIIELMMSLSRNIASFEEFACSEVVKQIESDVAEMRIDFDAPEEELSELHRRTRSNYLTYQAAHNNAANRLWRRLDEMADRVELTRRVQ
jgi:ppGpp synthetase/RelA/SpoT-type nucleotidyltranferase